jgi:outer membrane receptor protein involved in Fe transport
MASLVALRFVFGLALVALLSLPAAAQEAAPEDATAPAAAEPASDSASFPGIEEIVVTATRRATSVQDIPIAVTAITAEGLQARGIADVKDLQQVAPSLTITDSNSTTNGGVIRIRGMGTSGNNPGLESAVGSFIDGVYRSRAGLALQDLVDVERVEILRGPQGTLFGKNTSAGLIHVITKQPEFEWGGHVSGSVGNFDLRKVQGSVTGPILDELLAFRLAGTVHVRDGYYDDIDTKDTFADRDRWALKGQLLWTPTENFDTRLIVDYTKMREHCCPATYWVAGLNANNIAAVGGTVSGLENSDFLKVGTNYDPREDVDDWGISAESNWDLEWTRIKTILAYRRTDIFRTQDIDFTNADVLLPGDTDEDWENWSLELQLGGDVESLRLDWLFGFYGYTEDLVNSGQVRLASRGPQYVGRLVQQVSAIPGIGAFIGSLINPGEGRSSTFDQDNKGYSFFTHDIFHLTDRFDLTVGGRYIWERKKGSGIHNGAAPGTISSAPFCDRITGTLPPFISTLFLPLRNTLSNGCDNFSFEDSYTNDDWTGTLQLQYALTDDVNVYGSIARGFKSGGFNLDADAFNCIPRALVALGGPQPAGTVVSGNGLGAVYCSPFDATQFKPEFSYNYELGVKSQFWDGRVTLNAAFFTTIFKGFQLNQFTGLGFIISNVSRVRARGGEVELTVFPLEGMIGNFSVTYADTRYGDNVGVCFDLQRPDLSVNRCPSNPDPATGGDTPPLGYVGPPGSFSYPRDQFADGHRITQSPAWSGSLSLSLQRPFFGTGWFWYGGGNFYYRGRHKTSSDLDPLKAEDAYTKLNLQAGFRSPSERFDVQLWANNVTDEIVNTGIFDSVFQAGSTSAFKQAPRMYGVTASYRFGE